MSTALQNLEVGVEEVGHLLSADPTPRGGVSPQPAVTRAVIRAAVVLLCSHFERYLRSVTEEVVEILNNSSVDAERLSLEFRLQHTRVGVDKITRFQWEKREESLRNLITSDGWLWTDASELGTLDASRVLTWFKSPDPKRVKRLFKFWGIEDIFGSITRKPQTRAHFHRRLKELVEKRNRIAHGELAVEATRADIKMYEKSVTEFCRRADSALRRALKRNLGVSDVW